MLDYDINFFLVLCFCSRVDPTKKKKLTYVKK